MMEMGHLVEGRGKRGKGAGRRGEGVMVVVDCHDAESVGLGLGIIR